MANRHISGFLLLFACGVWSGCAPTAQSLIQFDGVTMGTTYHISYGVDSARMHSEASDAFAPQATKHAVDSLLVALNQSVSTYIPSSIVSLINTSQDATAWHPIDAHFTAIFSRAEEIYRDTEGVFNPAIGPLVNAYGFGPSERVAAPDSATVQEILKQVDFESFVLDKSGTAIQKRNPLALLDFSAIAKGYGVDLIANLLEKSRVSNYFIEIGGEIRTGGRHPEGRSWRTGIEKPSLNVYSDQEMQEIVELRSAAMATSGNYRNYYEQDGKKFVHIIDPFTGYSRPSSLLSVSVLASDCTTADAYATALMVLGIEKGVLFVEARPELEAFFIWVDDEGEFQETKSSSFPRSVSN